MKKPAYPFVIVALAIASIAVDVPPAEQPKTDRLKPDVHKATNPALEAIIKKIPAEMVPKVNDTAEQKIAKGRKLREWSKTNADGQAFKADAFKWSVVGGVYYTEDGTRIEIVGDDLGNKMRGLKNGDPVTITGKLGKGSVLARINAGKLVYGFALSEASAAPR